MRRFFFTVVGLAVLALPAASFAGVSNGPHNMSLYTGGGAPTEELCFGCHIPHGAKGDNLWSMDMDTTGADAGMSAIQRLCFTCHDGSIATLYDVFDLADNLIDHVSPGGADCSGDNACHDVHNQPALDGKFLTEGVGPNLSLCENCHDDIPHPSWSGGDRTAAGNHLIGTAANGLVCEDCHGAHTGVAQGDGTNNSYILKVNNEPTGGQWGQACIACHNNQSPFVGIVTDVFNYSGTEYDGSLSDKHPTYGGGNSMSGCDECHTVHGATNNGYLLNAASHNAGADFCVSCHTASGLNAPGVGTGTHSTGDITSWGGNPGTLPWAATIDDNGTIDPDWPTATADRMVCETCHSVHKNGEAGYFTRIAQTEQNELCVNCHDQN
jgi:predicted CXXCH cytochrome family protein